MIKCTIIQVHFVQLRDGSYKQVDDCVCLYGSISSSQLCDKDAVRRLDLAADIARNLVDDYGDTSRNKTWSLLAACEVVSMEGTCSLDA